MIPYIEIEPIEIFGYPLAVFGVLVVAAVAVGVLLTLRRGRRLGVDEGELRYFMVVVLVSGFFAAHIFDVLFYYPSLILEDPWVLLDLSNGLSSFGGIVGAVAGALFWKYYGLRPWFKIGKDRFHRPVRREEPAKILPFMDIPIAIFPVAWVLGRLGCSIVHDHPGIAAPAGSWLAVAFGPGPAWRLGPIVVRMGSEPRYDLGLLEMLFAALVAIAFAFTWRRGGNRGWYVAASCVLYAPVRFALDFLRESDAAAGDIRYWELTPAQWGCFALFAFGVGLGLHLWRGRGRSVRIMS